jgi:hypothetical protein
VDELVAHRRHRDLGDEVGLAYDPLIAKLVAHGRTRDEALDLLAAALAETEVGGVTTNLPFLRWLVAHPVVRAGAATTAFLVYRQNGDPARSHDHAFYLPSDEDGDGRIDHVTIYAAGKFSRDDLSALDRSRSGC